MLVIATCAIAQAPATALADDSKQIKNELAKCSGNFFLSNAAIKSNIVSLGSQKNNEDAIEFNFISSSFFSKIGKTIIGDDFESMSEAYFDSQISKFNNQIIPHLENRIKK
jgi:hypothetical protein